MTTLAVITLLASCMAAAEASSLGGYGYPMLYGNYGGYGGYQKYPVYGGNYMYNKYPV